MKYLIALCALLISSGCGSDGGDAGNANAGAANSAGSGNEAGAPSDSSCTAAREQLIGAVDTVSTGQVLVLSESEGVTKIYVDATAGGPTLAATNPWTFISLADPSLVEVSDVTATSSKAWDLALKRPLLYTNSGDGGPGDGGALLLDKDFADVAVADADNAELSTEKFFAEECAPIVDVTNAVATSFSGWYDYDDETHGLSPHPGTWLVRGGTGALYKLRIDSYYGTSEGELGMAGGGYLIEVSPL